MHAHLRRSVDVIDERKVLDRLNRRLNEMGAGAVTTAVLATYYPPRPHSGVRPEEPACGMARVAHREPPVKSSMRSPGD
jgi:hypothetical protein